MDHQQRSMRPSGGFSRRPSSLLASLRDIQQLIDECDAALQRDSTCLHTLAIRGHACMKAKLWDVAIRDFSQLLHCRPDDIHSRFSRGMALFKCGQVERAHKDFSQVLELNPHHVMARYARAGCYNTEGEFHEAILDYTIALEHDEKEHESAFRIEKNRLGDSRRSDNFYQQQHPQDAGTAHSGHQSIQRLSMAQCPLEPSQPALGSPARRSILSPGDSRTEASNDTQPARSAQFPAQTHQSVLSVSSLPSSLTPQPVSRVPRRVVQVRVNLSEFADSSSKSSASSLSPKVFKAPTVAQEQHHAAAAAPPETQPPPRLAAPASQSVSSSTPSPAPQPPLVRPRVIRKVTVTL